MSARTVTVTLTDTEASRLYELLHRVFPHSDAQETASTPYSRAERVKWLLEAWEEGGDPWGNLASLRHAKSALDEAMEAEEEV